MKSLGDLAGLINAQIESPSHQQYQRIGLHFLPMAWFKLSSNGTLTMLRAYSVDIPDTAKLMIDVEKVIKDRTLRLT